MTHPYLVREARLIALARALCPLAQGFRPGFRFGDVLRDDGPLAGARAAANAAARAEAYAAAGLAPVAPGEDAEAVRRQRLYWRHVRPAPAPTPTREAA